MGVRAPLLTETPQSVLASLWYFAGYKEQPRDRRADRRRAAHGDEHARIATRVSGA